MNTDSDQSDNRIECADAALCDEGFVCIGCDYNLTGSVSERCPECGCIIDWDEVRRRSRFESDRCGTHWERYRGIHKPIGFLITTLRAALLPWRFAQDIPTVPRVKPAMAFAGICVAISVATAQLSSSPDLPAYIAWYTGVACHVLLQVALLGFLLPPRFLKHGYRFWLVISLYTTYPIMTEGIAQPPYIVSGYSSIWPFYGGANQGEWIPTLHYYVWWVGLFLIAHARVSGRRRTLILLLLIGIPAMTFVSSFAGCGVGEFFD